MEIKKNSAQQLEQNKLIKYFVRYKKWQNFRWHERNNFYQTKKE